MNIRRLQRRMMRHRTSRLRAVVTVRFASEYDARRFPELFWPKSWIISGRCIEFEGKCGRWYRDRTFKMCREIVQQVGRFPGARILRGLMPLESIPNPKETP